MLSTSFEYSSSSDLPADIETPTAIKLLHDHDVVVSLDSQYNSHELVKEISETQSEYRVDTQLSFIPRSLWKGGVKYNSIYTKLERGCDITVDAPFFKSVNRWRIEDETDGRPRITITSESTCGKAFVGSVKSFMKSSHEQQRSNFLKELAKNASTQV